VRAQAGRPAIGGDGGPPGLAPVALARPRPEAGAPPLPDARAGGANIVLRLSPEGRRFIMREEGLGPATLVPHWPGGNSGVTLGYGYDLGGRTRAEVLADLRASGLDAAEAEILAGAAGRTGADARQWVDRHGGGLRLTPEQREALFSRTVPPYEAAVRRGVAVAVNPNEFDALVSFAFNAGPGAFARSGFRAALNEGDRARVAELWAGTRIPSDPRLAAGIRARRQREIALFLRPYGQGH
jgi:GH24 family phage-related lysozyme (muramidase)